MPKTAPNEPVEVSTVARLWIEHTIERFLKGHAIQSEFTMFSHGKKETAVVVVDTSRTDSKDEAAFLCKFAVAKQNPEEYIFASESWMHAGNDDQDKRMMEAVMRGDISIKDLPGAEEILTFVYGSMKQEYLHIVHFDRHASGYTITKREWFVQGRSEKQGGRFSDFRSFGTGGTKERGNRTSN